MTRAERRAFFESIVQGACERPGKLAAETRRALVDGAALPGAAGDLVERIRHAAHAVTDADVEAARSGGCDDDQLYELTVTTALGQSRQRLAAVLRALKRGD